MFYIRSEKQGTYVGDEATPELFATRKQARARADELQEATPSSYGRLVVSAWPGVVSPSKDSESWHVRRHGSGFDVYDENGLRVADCGSRADDAQLVAAAPALLAAAQAIAEHLWDCDGYVYDRLRAAIASATGQEDDA